MLVKGGTFIFSKLLSSIASSNLIDLFLIGGNITFDLDGETSMDLVTSSLASSMKILDLGALVLTFELPGSVDMGMQTSNHELVCDH